MILLKMKLIKIGEKMEEKKGFDPEQMSLCKNGCYCSTHTLDDGTCGKCGVAKNDRVSTDEDKIDKYQTEGCSICGCWNSDKKYFFITLTGDMICPDCYESVEKIKFE